MGERVGNDHVQDCLLFVQSATEDSKWGRPSIVFARVPLSRCLRLLAERCTNVQEGKSV
jgi:hypothetical protein